MNRLKELAPKMKALQEKYKDDKQKLSSNMMSMYKDENVSPFGGCLPIILQIPIFFAFYRVLLNAVELQGASWMLWIDDLSLMDPYYILPVLMTLSMFIQQKLTPTQIQDELQKKMMLFMPLIFGIFFLWFPAGLVLYWIVNNTFTIVHQLYINKLFVNAKEARDQKKHIKK
jgi:YidC/Oxa1 family membrane protein insertase